MAQPSNKARVGEAFDLLATGLLQFVDVRMKKTVKEGQDWAAEFVRTSKNPDREYSLDDPSFLLNVMIDCWNGTFDRQLPRTTRNLLFTLRDKRNEWAHGKRIMGPDAQFTLSGILDLLERVDAREADPVRLSLEELSRTLYEKQRDQGEAAQSGVLGVPKAGLKPWREVIHPHSDVSLGDFMVAEFAADLELVRQKKGSQEYTDPRLFFERTYITDGLRDLMTLATKRIAGIGGEPIVNCQTNFGGGKTHSLISLYHLFSGIDISSLPDEIGDLVSAAGVEEIPPVNRAVVVGNRFAAGEAHEKDDGTVINTIWGEIAYQLGGKEAFDIVAESDRKRTNPADTFERLVAEYAPCLILIDEWVAYARELYERNDLPGGTFDSQFGFAQTLCDSAKAAPGAMVVLSIPASEGVSSPGEDPDASFIEVGGVGGRQALERLTTVVGREAQEWQSATGDEPYKIVRRRLFEPFDDSNEDCVATAEAFGELYRTNRADFPTECARLDYVEQIRNSYPIHPEIFVRLYEDWSNVDRFQQTRGVLRLMAATIHSLWASDDRSPLILPCSIPLDDPAVAGELARKLSDDWAPIISADIDGSRSRSAEIDREVPHLGEIHATRRAARTIFLGATPNVGSPNQGLGVDRVMLGSVFAGERPGPITDALGRLRSMSPYLWVDRERYWFDVHQNVNRTARDDAVRFLAGDRGEIRAEVERRLRSERGTGDFKRVHVAPDTSDDVVDEAMARLVVLGSENPHIANSDQSSALEAARSILDKRGNSPRQYRNMLVFAAADQTLLERLDEVTADYLAWSSICERREELNLDAHQTTQAKNNETASDDAVELRIAETYKYALVPHQPEPSSPEIQFDVLSLEATGTVAERASRKLVTTGSIQPLFASQILRERLNGVLAPRWEEGHVKVSDLWEDFARYLYLPRLCGQDVLVSAVEQGPGSTTWQSDGFATAVGYEDGKYLGLVGGADPGKLLPTALIVKPEIADPLLRSTTEDGADETPSPGGGDTGPAPPIPPVTATTFRGNISLDSQRPAHAFGQVSEEVLQHLLSQLGTDVEVTVSIRAIRKEGFEDDTIRTVTENARTLNFDEDAGFS